MRRRRELEPTIESDRRIPLRDRAGLCGCIVFGSIAAAVLAYWIYQIAAR